MLAKIMILGDIYPWPNRSFNTSYILHELYIENSSFQKRVWNTHQIHFQIGVVQSESFYLLETIIDV